MPRQVACFVFPRFQLLDLSGPLAAFQMANDQHPAAYRLAAVSAAGGPVASSGVAVTTRRITDRPLDTFIVVGGAGVHAAVASPATTALVRAVAAKARRSASVCTGTFLFAAAGLLDRRRATTHWRYAARLQAEFPQVRLETDRIFVRDGTVWSSAGVTAGIDLALALIEADLDTGAAWAVARDYRRPGGQSQFSTMQALDPASPRVGRALGYARDHLAEKLSVETLADAAHLSPRQFSRVFLAETGHTPAKAIERLRAETARPMVEDGDATLEAIARAVGFGDPERMRQGFIRSFGQPPQALRRSARSVRSEATA